MKNKRIILLATATIAFLGVSVFKGFDKQATPLNAQPHTANYSEYTYSGTYYNNLDKTGTDGLQGTFRKALSSLIFPSGWYIYGSSGSDHLSTQLQYADEDPSNSENMIYFYTRDSVKKNAASSWNREHVWPQSLSNGNWDDSTGTEKAGTDLLHIRPTYNKTNEVRGNCVYADLNHNGELKYNNIVYGYKSGNNFEPLDSIKGDIARIIMYVWTAYYDHYKDSRLLVTKTIESYNTLLKWHTEDKPDELEGNRNNYVETSKQKNRNPFVDHPEYAWKIFGDNASADVKAQCKEVYPDNNELPPNPSSSSEPQSSCIDSDSSSSEPVITSEIPSSEPSSEISVASSEEPSILPASSNQQEEPKPSEKKGCNGSFIASVSLLSVSALIGLVFVFSKKK